MLFVGSGFIDVQKWFPFCVTEVVAFYYSEVNLNVIKSLLQILIH